MSEDPQDMKD